MTYYDQKQLLAQSFGTAKAQRKLASVLTNRVEDEPVLDKDGVATKKKKGSRDTRLQPMAEEIKQKTESIKKEQATASQRRKVMYGKEVLMPHEILQNIPFKQTHEALKKDDEEGMKNLLCPFVVRLAKNIWQYSWDSMGDDKSEKRRVLKSLVYLDALITLYRMPAAFEFSMPDLCRRFRDLPEVALH